MSRKALVMLGMTIGSVVGSYAPMLWHDDPFSVTAILLGAVGGIVGIWIAFKITS